MVTIGGKPRGVATGFCGVVGFSVRLINVVVRGRSLR